MGIDSLGLQWYFSEFPLYFRLPSAITLEVMGTYLDFGLGGHSRWNKNAPPKGIAVLPIRNSRQKHDEWGISLIEYNYPFMVVKLGFPVPTSIFFAIDPWFINMCYTQNCKNFSKKTVVITTVFLEKFCQYTYMQNSCQYTYKAFEKMLQ